MVSIFIMKSSFFNWELSSIALSWAEVVAQCLERSAGLSLHFYIQTLLNNNVTCVLVQVDNVSASTLLIGSML